MPWQGEPIPTHTGVDWLIDLLRVQIADQKYKVTQVVQEDTGIVSSGVMDEMFYTDNLPIVDDTDTYMRIGRWLYQEVDSAAAAAGLRAYVFNVDSGCYHIPEGAIYGEDQGRVKVGYSWIDEQTYKFSDTELKYYVQDSTVTINDSYYNFGHTVVGAGASLDISPAPAYDEIASYIYVKYATYLIKKQLEAEGFDNRIYVRDLNVTIDTTKGLGELAKSSRELIKEIEAIINELRLKGQVAAFTILDTYSTYVENDSATQWAAKYDSNWKDDKDFYTL